MKKLLMMMALISTLLTTACGKEGVHDSVFTKYISEYEQYYNISADGVDVKAVDKIANSSLSKGTVVGLCKNGNEVTIAMSFYTPAPNITKKALVWHELDHCVRGLGHDDRKEYDCAISYMNSYLPNSMCLAKIFDNARISYDFVAFVRSFVTIEDRDTREHFIW